MRNLQSTYVYCFVIALLLLFSENLKAQTSQLNPNTALKNYEVRSWKEIDDVVLGRVFDIDQDDEGYMWLATGRGLLRFDSQKIEAYNFKNVPFLRTETIREVEIGANNRIWFATRRGLYYVENKEAFEVKNAAGDPFTRILNLATNKKGDLYFVLDDTRELFKVVNNKVAKISKPDEKFYKVFKSRNGNILARRFTGAESADIIEFDENDTAESRFLQMDKFLSIYGMSEDPSGAMYVGTADNSVVKLENGIVTEIAPPGSRSDKLQFIEVQESGAVFYHQNDGLKRYLNGQIEAITVEDGLTNNFVRSLFTDRDGNLWVGTLNGLNFLSNGPFSNRYFDNDLKGDSFNVINQLADKTIIAGTKKSGLFEIVEDQLKPIVVSKTVGASIFSISHTNDSNEFLVGSENGLFLVRKENDHYDVKEQLAKGEVRRAHQRSNGEIWYNVRAGKRITYVLVPNETGIKNFKEAVEIEKLDRLWINSIYETADTTMWFATSKGVYKHQKGMDFNPENVPDFLSYFMIGQTSKSKDDFWLASLGSGIFKVESDTIYKYDTRNGLSDNRSKILLSSENGGFWTYKHDEDYGEFERLIPYLENGKHHMGIGEKYSLKNDIGESAGFPNEIALDDGSFLLNVGTHLIHFNPKDIFYRQPHVRFDKLIVDTQMINKEDYETISFNQEDFEFHYSSVDFIRGESQLFEVKLEGYDNEWKSVGKRQVVYYPRLPSGDYTFKVRLHTPEFGNIEIESPVRIVKEFVWYQKKGVLFLFAIAFALLVYSIFQYRINQVKKQRTILRRKVDERTSELNALNQNLEATVVERTKEISKINDVLTEKEERYKYALEASTDGIWDWDVKNDKIQFSPAIYTMLGFEPYEFPETRAALYKQIHAEEIRKEHVDYHTRFSSESGDEILLDEYHMVRKDRKLVWVQVKGKIVERDEKGIPLRIVGTHVDITKDKEKSKELLDAVLNTEFVERSRISKDIHDGLQQTLTIASLNLQWVRKDLGGLTEKAKEKFEQGWKYLQSSITESRNVAHSLMPKEVLDFGVISAYEILIEEIDNAMDGTDFNFYHNFESEKIENQQIEIILYRILQEALNNITKYAAAKTVTIQLKDYDDMYMLTIEDNGVGFDVEKLKTKGKGMGFKSMQNRLDAISGFLEIDSMPGSGTTILVEINK